MAKYNKVTLKSDDEITIMRENGRIIAELFQKYKELISPGISTLDLDNIAKEFVASKAAVSSFKGYGGFPGHICTSVNDVVIHGIPSSKDILKEGDIVGIDIGVFKNGFHADSAFTFTVGSVSLVISDFLEHSKHSLALGIANARPGKSLFDIANGIESYLKKEKLGVVREFVGHGIGKELHEPPQVPNYCQLGLSKIKLKEGMVLAIEPMVTLGEADVYTTDDDWTVKTSDQSLACHFEHTVAITKKGPLILTNL